MLPFCHGTESTALAVFFFLFCSMAGGVGYKSANISLLGVYGSTAELFINFTR
jgi:hypothetical protein